MTADRAGLRLVEGCGGGLRAEVSGLLARMLTEEVRSRLSGTVNAGLHGNEGWSAVDALYESWFAEEREQASECGA